MFLNDFHYYAVARHYRHAASIAYGRFVVGYGFPFVSVDFHVARIARADRLYDDARAADKGIGIARAVVMVRVEIPYGKRTYAKYANA